MPKTFFNFKQDIKKEDISLMLLKIISDFECPYFNSRKIRFGLYSQYDIELRGRPSIGVDLYNDSYFRKALSTRIGHITRKLKEHGYIKKFNTNTWKKIKEIDITDPNLYSNAKEEKEEKP